LTDAIAGMVDQIKASHPSTPKRKVTLGRPKKQQTINKFDFAGPSVTRTQPSFFNITTPDLDHQQQTENMEGPTPE
jgi:hypothetical protein